MCFDNRCPMHLSDKEGSGWFSKKPHNYYISSLNWDMTFNKEIYIKSDNDWERYNNTDDSEDGQSVLGTETRA